MVRFFANTLLGICLSYIANLLRGNLVQYFLAVVLLTIGPALSVFAIVLLAFGLDAAQLAAIVAFASTMVFWARQ